MSYPQFDELVHDDGSAAIEPHRDRQQLERLVRAHRWHSRGVAPLTARTRRPAAPATDDTDD